MTANGSCRAGFLRKQPRGEEALMRKIDFHGKS